MNFFEKKQNKKSKKQKTKKKQKKTEKTNQKQQQQQQQQQQKRLFKNHSWQSVDAILENVSLPKTIVNVKLFILRLPSFSVQKIKVVRHVKPD